MLKRTRESGQSLIEILFAITLFVIGVVTIGYLVIESQRSLQNNIEFTQASLLAEEGIEAVYSIRDRDFSLLAEGTYGISAVNGSWELLTASSDTTSKFIRSVTIEDIDGDIKKIVSTVTWDEQEQSVAFSSYVTNWKDYGGNASALLVATSTAALSISGEELQGITIENTSIEPITIAEISLQYDSLNTMHQITIDGTPVFLMASSSSSAASSGDIIDIEDYTLQSGIGPNTIDAFAFNGSMLGIDILITFIMSDASVREVAVDL